MERLNAWIERARDAGFVAIDVSAASTDPMQAELCGFSLAVAANEACYVPLGHRQGGEGGSEGLFRGDIAPGQIAEGAALDALKPLFTDRGVLKIGHDLKFAWQIFALRGIEIAPYDDTMLMSYALDAGRQNHSIESLAESTFTHAAIDIGDAAQARQDQDHLRRSRHRPGDRIRRRESRHRAAALAGAQAAARRRAGADGLRDAGASAGCRARAHGAARHFDRPARAVAAVRRVRAGSRRPRSRDQQRSGRDGQSGQPETARRYSVWQARPAGRHQDQDGPMGDRGPCVGRTRRARQ